MEMDDDIEWLEGPTLSEAERARRLQEIERRVRDASMETCDHCGRRARCVLTVDPAAQPWAKNDPSLWCAECWNPRAEEKIDGTD